MTHPTILNFPVQKQEPDDCLTDLEAVHQLKLKAVNLLNEVEAGTYTLDFTNIQGLLRVNRLCQAVGIPPLDIDLDALTSR
jgi:hypothetical protein